MTRCRVLLACAGVLVTAHAFGSAVVYEQGTFARPGEEKTLLVWDEATHTEHLLRAFALKGDAERIGVLVVTPSAPTVTRESDDAINRTAALLEPPSPVRVLDRAVEGIEASTFHDEAALADWLAKNHFADRASMRGWVKPYLDKGWYATGLRTASQGTGDRKLEVATVRFTFHTDAPIFPYGEAPVEEADEAAYRAKYNPHQAYRGYSYGMRGLDVWLVAQEPLQAMAGPSTASLAVADALRLKSADVAVALGDTKAWGFNVHARPGWVVTHLTERVWQRASQVDLGFQSYDLPPARLAPGAPERVAATPPAPGAQDSPRPPRKLRWLVVGLLLLGLVAATAAASELAEQGA